MTREPVAQREGGAARPAERAALEAELAQVGELLEAALDGLYPPLSGLARAAIRKAAPWQRALLVLAVAVGADEDAAHGSDLRERRVLLAAALEMLAVALAIHTTLLGEQADDRADEPAAVDRSLDKSIVGSTILTADFCFGRAAWLAAQTESPVVVDRFAQALKTVSEGLLRAQRVRDKGPGGEREDAASGETEAETSDGTPADAYDAAFALALAGVSAAAHLAGLNPQAQAAAHRLAPLLARATPAPTDALEGLSPPQVARWNAAFAWLADASAAQAE